MRPDPSSPRCGSATAATALALLATALTLFASTARATEPLVTQPLTQESCRISPSDPSPSSMLPGGGSDRALGGATLRGVPGAGSLSQAPMASCPSGSPPNPDDLDSYPVGSTGYPFYSVVDRTDEKILWHCYTAVSEPCAPQVPSGTAAIWCGTAQAGEVAKPGYPNNTYQILYVDTGSHASSYTLTLDYSVGVETSNDYLYLIGGGTGATDPIGCDRATLDQIIETGTGYSGEELLVRWTGNIRADTPGASSINTLAGTVDVTGSSIDPPQSILAASITVSADHRALYFVLRSDSRFSQEDGAWCTGWGAVLDRLHASDSAQPIYDDECEDFCSIVDWCGGCVLRGTADSPVVAARVARLGAFASIQPASSLPTSDFCTPGSGNLFLMAEASTQLLFPSFQSIEACPFWIPPGTSRVRARWTEYLDLPEYGGFSRYVEFRVHRAGGWSRWRNAAPGGGVHQGGLQFWRPEMAELADCGPGADSVQLRYTVQCVPELTVDHTRCEQVPYGLMFDDFRLDFVAGVAAPVFGVFPGSVAQSTFVDGGDPASVNCTPAQIAAHECWPGVRGSGLAPGLAIDDNFNSPSGDSITLSIRVSGLASNAGINWHYAFDKCVGGGRVIAHANPAFHPEFDAPRVVYRLFDPARWTWSPFDSSELDVDGLSLACLADGADTTVTGCLFRMDWPPRDKYYVNSGGQDIGPSADADLPGAPGWTLNGKTKYSQVRFLPRGTRLQYYFKGVDSQGGVAYQFRSDQPAYELDDLPYLPGSALRAPDIIEFDVLRRVYPWGWPGSLAQVEFHTPILILDGAYTAWSDGEDPVIKALRGLGVRADRYRVLQGTAQGNNIGGHELPGQIVPRQGTFFPNMNEYGILDSLKAWYRILIISSHARQGSALAEQDARLIRSWWESDTGVNGGDRCIFASGDDLFSSLTNVSYPSPPPFEERLLLASSVFGVQNALSSWTGTATNQYPTITDRFVGGGNSASIDYKLDGGCPVPARFDGLVPRPEVQLQNAAPYPGGVFELAGVSYMTERDAAPDNDRNKALAYGFSIQHVRDPEATPDALGHCCCCAYGGMRQRMTILYRFLTACRGPGSSLPQCWPCPADTSLEAMMDNWFWTFWPNGGALYPIQDYMTVTGVELEAGPGAPRFVNRLEQNRPNPFNPETVIGYAIAGPGQVAVRIFDVAGRQIRVLVSGFRQAGPHVARWNGRDDAGRMVGSGTYFYRITYPDGTQSARKMLMLR